MNLEGRIHIALSRKEDALSVKIRSQRPVLASRIFEGKSITDALGMVPLIFSLCGQAQAVAAVRAVESALETGADQSVENGREILLRLEALWEHLWRIFIDWPNLLGEEPRSTSLAKINQTITTLRKALDNDGALTQRPGASHWNIDQEMHSAWNSLYLQISGLMFDPTHEESQVFPFFLLDKLLEHNWANLGAFSTPSLYSLSSDQLSSALRGEDGDTYVAKPSFGNQPYETGPFARQRRHPALARARETFGDGVYTRFAARVLEVTKLLDELNRLFEGESFEIDHAEDGIAQVQAVRGLLAHCVDIDGEKISRYRILAPTEWNFHPDGVVHKMLTKLTGTSEAELQQQARLVIHAVDPCVGYDIEVNGGAVDA